MRDDQLLQDLDAAVKTPYDKYEWMAERGITTYSQLFAFIRDENADAELREQACWALSRLNNVVDRRRAVPALLAALNSRFEDVRDGATWALGSMESKRAMRPLLTLLTDRTQPESVRSRAIYALSSIQDPRAIPIFKQIIYDPTEEISLRGDALEWLDEEPNPIPEFIQLLSHPEPDIRFWAAYRLSSTYSDISPALAQLDQLVADDQQLPFGFGWQVGREAMLPFETIYYRKIVPSTEEGGHHWYGHGPMYLISPAPEYSTLLWRFRHWTENATYTTDPLPDIKLNIDFAWLARELKSKWPEIRLNVREPRPQAYLLDWHWQAGEKHLMGALHRDQYAVVITADHDLIVAFAAWYRTLFPDEQHLYLYEWADVHAELKPGMTATDIEKASERPSVSAMDIIAEDLTFG